MRLEARTKSHKQQACEKNIDPLQKFKLLVGHMWSRVYPILKQVRFEIPKWRVPSQ